MSVRAAPAHSQQQKIKIAMDLVCSCGCKTLGLHRVSIWAGFEPGGTIKKTIINVDIPNETLETTINQTKIQHSTDARKEEEAVDGLRSKVELAFYCYECKSWRNVLSVSDADDGDVAQRAEWERPAKRERPAE